jgi:hypothetical protein
MPRCYTNSKHKGQDLVKSLNRAVDAFSRPPIRLLISLLLTVLVTSCGGNSPGSGTPPPVQSLNHAPVANGGGVQTAYAGTSTIALDGSHSSDADNDPITFKWSIVASTAPGATLTNETTAHANLTVTAPGTYTVRLIVNDGALNSTPDDVAVLFAEGVLLQGDPSALAKDLVLDLAPVGVSPAQVQDGIILTRLDLFLDPAATVGQLNAALVHVQGSIVTMLHTIPSVTIAIPQPVDLDALAALAGVLNGMPGVALASLAHAPAAKQLPPSPAGDQINLNQLAQLLPARFPAAWNASLLATKGFNNESPCAARKVSVLIADEYKGTLAGAGELQLGTETESFPIFGLPASNSALHGYEVAATLAAQFDAANPTGANPFTDCLDLNGVQLFGLSEFQSIARIVSSFPAGRFLLNYSEGYGDELKCLATSCTPAVVLQELSTALQRAYHTVTWKALSTSRWDDFLAGVAAGNERDLPATIIYPGLGVSVADSFMSIATLNQPLLAGFLSDTSLWDPKQQPPPGGFPTLLPRDLTAFNRYAQALGADHIGPAGNVLMVGAGTAGFTSQDVAEAAFSDSSPDVFAVGSAIVMPTETIEGSSFSAPQVTGLASYLWLLSAGAKAHIPNFNDLNDLPTSTTRQAILANTRPGTGVNLIDAYATILSIDLAQPPATATAPIRLALLDLNNDGKFDEGDVAAFLGIFLDSSGAHVEPTTQDYSRFDLNGDGFTGGSRTEQFDLDRVGSTQYGATRYDTSVSQQIEGSLVPFDETKLTDLQILCYYAYSPLYQGDTTARKNLLEGHCGSTLGFPGTERISTAIQALDAVGNQVVPTQFASSDSTETPIAPPSVGLHATGTYTQTPGTFNPVHFDVSGSSTASSIDSLIAPVGTFNGTVSCAASGPNTQDGVTAMPSLSSSTAGNLFISLPASRTIKFQVNASLNRGDKIGSESRISGFIEVEYVDLTTGSETNPSIRIDDNSPAAVNFTVAEPSHGVIISWSIDALCQQNPAPGGLEEARSASFAISYSVVDQ